jgi:hypothetical protein
MMEINSILRRNWGILSISLLNDFPEENPTPENQRHLTENQSHRHPWLENPEYQPSHDFGKRT